MINIGELQEKLEKLPSEIYEQEKKTLEAKERLEMQKIEYDVSYSSALVVSQAPNATEKKSSAVISSAEVKKDVIKLEMEYLRQNAYLTAKNNQFIALRKISSLEEKLMQSQVSGN